MNAQSMEALKVAKTTYVERAQFKKAIKERSLKASDLILLVPKGLEKMMPADLICCLPRFHRKMAEGMVHDTGASLYRNLGELSERQREELAAMVADWEKTREKVAA